MIPCEECLVYAACRYKESVKCDDLHSWALGKQLPDVIEIIDRYFDNTPIRLGPCDSTVLTRQLIDKIEKKQKEIHEYIEIKTKGYIIDEQ